MSSFHKLNYEVKRQLSIVFNVDFDTVCLNPTYEYATPAMFIKYMALHGGYNELCDKDKSEIRRQGLIVINNALATLTKGDIKSESTLYEYVITLSADVTSITSSRFNNVIAAISAPLLGESLLGDSYIRSNELRKQLTLDQDLFTNVVVQVMTDVVGTAVERNTKRMLFWHNSVLRNLGGFNRRFVSLSNPVSIREMIALQTIYETLSMSRYPIYDMTHKGSLLNCVLRQPQQHHRMKKFRKRQRHQVYDHSHIVNGHKEDIGEEFCIYATRKTPEDPENTDGEECDNFTLILRGSDNSKEAYQLKQAMYNAYAETIFDTTNELDNKILIESWMDSAGDIEFIGVEEARQYTAQKNPSNMDRYACLTIDTIKSVLSEPIPTAPAPVRIINATNTTTSDTLTDEHSVTEYEFNTTAAQTNTFAFLLDAYSEILYSQSQK